MRWEGGGARREQKKEGRREEEKHADTHTVTERSQTVKGREREKETGKEGERDR